MQPDRTVLPPRRVRVRDRRGIYYRIGKDSRRRYEITYRDTEGRQRWKVIPGGLRDAEAALAQVKARLRRGERVVPTRQTFEQVANDWLAVQSELRPRTRDGYESALRIHVFPRLGRLKIHQITEDHIALLIADMRPRYKGWTIRATLTPIGGTLGYAERRGLIGTNPMKRLQRGERPSVGRREMRVLDRDEIGSLIDNAPEAHRALLATAVFTGLRLGELLGLVWANVDFDGGAVQVRKQLDRSGRRVEPKTPQAVRNVVLMPALSRVLKEHRLRSLFSADGDLVFPSSVGTGVDHSVPRRALRNAMKAAELDGADRPSSTARIDRSCAGTTCATRSRRC
jgi:integrase